MKSTIKLWSFTCILLCPIAGMFSQNFTEIAKLSAEPRNMGQNFGHYTSISGSYAIVGAYNEELDKNEENPLQKAGAAYIFEKENDIWVFKQKLVQEHRWLSDRFGQAVSISGNYAVVGIPGEDLDDPNDPNGNKSKQLGAAMIYKRAVDGVWNEHQLISGGDLAKTGDQFGFPIKIKNGVILSGALNTGKWENGKYLDRIGSVYVFEKDEATDQWVRIKKIMPSDGVGQDRFGKMVDVDDGTIIIGASHHEPHLNDRWVGAAYVYSKNETGDWVEQQKLEAFNRGYESEFGDAVAISGDYIFIGAPGHIVDENSTSSTRAGATYVYKRDAAGVWNETQYIVLENRSRTTDNYFGQSVSMVNDLAVVSADEIRFENDITTGKGGCFLYKLNKNTHTWQLIQTIVPKTNNASKNFGISVRMDERSIIVGDLYDSGIDFGTAIERAGTAHVFELPSALSIEDVEHNGITIYPNPIGNQLFIKLENFLSTATIEITDMLGRSVYKINNIHLHKLYTINAHFSKGNYVLKISTAEKMYTSKFVKK